MQKLLMSLLITSLTVVFVGCGTTTEDVEETVEEEVGSLTDFLDSAVDDINEGLEDASDAIEEEVTEFENSLEELSGGDKMIEDLLESAIESGDPKKCEDLGDKTLVQGCLDEQARDAE